MTSKRRRHREHIEDEQQSKLWHESSLRYERGAAAIGSLARQVRGAVRSDEAVRAKRLSAIDVAGASAQLSAAGKRGALRRAGGSERQGKNERARSLRPSRTGPIFRESIRILLRRRRLSRACYTLDTEADFFFLKPDGTNTTLGIIPPLNCMGASSQVFFYGLCRE